MPTTARLQNSKQVDQRRERTIGKRKGEWKGRKGSKRGGTSPPLVPRSTDIPEHENFPKPGITKQQHFRDYHIEYSTIVLSQNILLGLAEYKLLRNLRNFLTQESEACSRVPLISLAFSEGVHLYHHRVRAEFIIVTEVKMAFTAESLSIQDH